MTYHTNIRHQELVRILGSRNLYLRLVYAHIANYTQVKVKGAWCGEVKELAAQLELPIQTVRDQLKILTTKGLVMQNGNTYTAAVLPDTAPVQNNTAPVQNSTPPYNPPIIDNNNDNNLTETTPCVPATENVGEIFMEYTFDIFLQAFHPTWPMRADRKADLRYKWEHEYSRAKKKFIMDDLFAHEAANTLTDLRDPLTYCEKFKIPAPYDYNGHEIPAGTQVFSAAYNGAWGMYTQKDIDDYNLELPKE